MSEKMSEKEMERKLDEAVEMIRRGEYTKFTRNYDPDSPTRGGWQYLHRRR